MNTISIAWAEPVEYPLSPIVVDLLLQWESDHSHAPRPAEEDWETASEAATAKPRASIQPV